MDSNDDIICYACYGFLGLIVGCLIGGSMVNEHYSKKLVEIKVMEYNKTTGKLEWIKTNED